MSIAVPTSTKRFEFGRHETFTIRHGWLGKGLARMREDRDGFVPDVATADALGLGSRMVKSLAYWLEATRLATVEMEGRSKKLTTSDVGSLIEKKDAYFEYPATWWFVHMALAGRNGTVFSWFFNDYAERSFDRTACVDAFLRHLKLHATKAATLQTAQRDVACLLASYSSDPSEPDDPEDGAVCPLNELRLVVHHRDTRRFEKIRPLDQIPLEVFIAAAAQAGLQTHDETLSVNELLSRRHGPGRMLGMTGEMIDAAASDAARIYAKEGVTYTLLGAERRLRVPEQPGDYWLSRHFSRIEAYS
jgi:hypothetical protein